MSSIVLQNGKNNTSKGAYKNDKNKTIPNKARCSLCNGGFNCFFVFFLPTGGGAG